MGILNSFEEKLAKIESSKDLESLRIEFLGKSGAITQVMKEIGTLPVEERKNAGRDLNLLKAQIEAQLDSAHKEIANKELAQRLASETIDVTLKPTSYKVGKIHPLSKTIEEIKQIFTGLGFIEDKGPEIENDWYNFTALNIGEDHPARQMHDTFYVENQQKLLRTHTSNVQIRYMQGKTPPIKVFSIGRVYRSDSDATHTPMFHQLEGLYIDKKVTMVDLKSYLEKFLKKFFAVEKLPTRLRPSYFPFTEPSAEMDVLCDRSSKQQIKFGEGNDWLEILGCGMVHPKVLENVGIDPEIYQGFAFGSGIERLAMLKYSIPDLRDMFSGDLRWLKHYGF